MDEQVREAISKLKGQDYCYLTTKGRVSGKPHRIEIWFGVQESAIYLLSGGGSDSDWVKNLLKDPEVTVRIAKTHFDGRAELVTDANDEKRARHLLAAKYYGWSEGKKLNDWASTALPIRIELKLNH